MNDKKESTVDEKGSVPPEALDLRSPNIAGGKRDELLRLFPEARTEGGKIDFDRLKLTLGEKVDVGKERYGLTWPGKADCFKAIQTPSIGTLRACPEESINFDTTENLIIEGDNLEVLKLLQKSYLGRAKLIYIDPPYNTGNDFIYPDNYSESLQTYLEYTGQVDAQGKTFSTNTETDGRFHSNWLRMCHPRLFLARNLLRDDGFIVVSIDDAEVSALRLLLNEVYGEENFVATLVWDRNRKNDAKYFSVGHEYMLVYARDKATLGELEIQLRAPKEGVDEVRTLFDTLRRQWGDDFERIALELRRFFMELPEDSPLKPLARYSRVDARGPYRDDGNINWPGGGGPTYKVLHPITGKPCKPPRSGWRYPNPARFQEEVVAGRIVFGPDHTTVPRVRSDLFSSSVQVLPSVQYSYAQTAAQQFDAIFDGLRVFDNPKPFGDLARLIEYLTGPDELVVDVFAGSGSTAHGVLEANRRASSSRRFLLVQLPEKVDATTETGRNALKCGLTTIAEIAKERMRRVIKSLNDGETGSFDLDNRAKQDRGFRVFKLAESNFKTWDGAAERNTEKLAGQLELQADNVRGGRGSQDILYEILLKSGFPLTTPVETLSISGKTVFAVSGGEMLVCLEKGLTLELIREIATRPVGRVICLDGGFAGNDQLKTNAVQIFKTKGIVFKTA